MALTKAQQAELERLQAEADKPEPRTDTGLAGILHAVLDVVSGNVPHLAAEVWADLHHQAEALAVNATPNAAADEPKQAADDEGQAADDAKAATSSAGRASSKAGKG